MTESPTYRLVNVSGGRYELTLVDAPECLALRAAPDAPPAELASGRWLVLAFAVWRSEDHESIELALEAAVEGAGGRRLAVLPFADVAELPLSVPGVTVAEVDAPVWLTLDDGRLRETRVEMLTFGEMRELLA